MNHYVSNRRRFFHSVAVGCVPGLLFSVAKAQGPGNAASRVAQRTRAQIAKRHSILSFTRATAKQRAVAAENARKAQEKLRKEWASKNRAKAKVTPASQVSMSTVCRDLNEPRVQAVKTASSPGARTSVMAVDVTTGNPVSSQVVNSTKSIGRGANVSEEVRAAANDPAVPGSAPSVFLTADVSMAAI